MPLSAFDVYAPLVDYFGDYCHDVLRRVVLNNANSKEAAMTQPAALHATVDERQGRAYKEEQRVRRTHQRRAPVQYSGMYATVCSQSGRPSRPSALKSRARALLLVAKQILSPSRD
jgi:hypothetical protein